MIHCDISRDPNTGKIIVSKDYMHLYIEPSNGSAYVGEPKALEMNAEIIRMIQCKQVPSVPVSEVVPMVSGWLKSHGYYRSGFTPCGKNVAGFDFKFLESIPGWGYPAIKRKHRCLDVGSLMLRPDDDHVPDLAECKLRANVPGRVTHRAIDDCEDCISIVEFWMSQQYAFIEMKKLIDNTVKGF